MLDAEISKAQRQVRTDAYQMSVGEVVSMYTEGDIVIDPEFQRLFRWESSQKSKLIESLLLGIPIPSIFVFERPDGRWELIDGLQRTSTILEFMGLLKSAEGQKPPSILDATKYLPSLANTVWEQSDRINVPVAQQVPLTKAHQLAIRRSRIGVEILKRPSDEETKYDLFQRLNAGGTVANAQELRNCIMLMVNPDYFRAIKQVAESQLFRRVLGIKDGAMEKQRHIALAVRFLVHRFIPYDGKLDVEEYIDEGMITLGKEGDIAKATDAITQTFNLLDAVAGENALRRLEDGQHSGRVGLVALESIAVGISKNYAAIQGLADPAGFVVQRIAGFWQQPVVATLMSPGLRGTSRIQETVPLGDNWFRP